MNKVQNSERCFDANMLSNAEILLTLALLIKGNYCNTSKAYITFVGSYNKNAAIATVSNACYELGIPFSNILSDSCQDRFYLWGNKLDSLLAKQCLLPDKGQKWKNKLKVPTSWHELTNDRRVLINNLLFNIAKVYNTKIAGPAVRLPDNNAFANGLLQLLAPINSDIQIRYGGTERSKPLLWKVVPIKYVQPEFDDFSDLL